MLIPFSLYISSISLWVLIEEVYDYLEIASIWFIQVILILSSVSPAVVVCSKVSIEHLI